MSETPIVAWPPTHEQREHLDRIAALVQQFGAERFTTAHIVRADERDFPDPWQQTIAAVHRTVYRLCWHAHWEPEVVVVDFRRAKPADHTMLSTSNIELASARAGVVTLDIAEIGNDDVAGLLSHRLGQAFLELAPGDPFRHAGGDISESAGSVAAVYLGLGVLVANSSMYRRYAARQVSNAVSEEQVIAKVGGLSIADATFLLAVQDIVRDDAPDSYETLHKPQQEWLERWRDLLDPHEDELRTILGLGDATSRPLERGAAPRQPPAAPERDLRKFNAGRATFRVPARDYWKAGLGFAAGIFGFLFPFGTIVGPVAMAGLTAAGIAVAKKHFMCSDPACGALMRTEVDECPGCGGRIVDTILSQRDRLDRYDELRDEGKLPPELFTSRTDHHREEQP